MSDRRYMRELSLINRLETEKALIDTVNGVNTEVLDKIQKDFIKTFFRKQENHRLSYVKLSGSYLLTARQIRKV
jgi:hypothetical protein